MGFPKNLIIKYRAAKPNGKRIHDETPNDAGIVPITIATMPVVKAYGNWVRTCSMWGHELAKELKIVVSDIGEQWSPSTDPVKTAAVIL